MWWLYTVGMVGFDYGKNNIYLALNSNGAAYGIKLHQKMSTGSILGLIFGILVSILLIVLLIWFLKGRGGGSGGSTPAKKAEKNSNVNENSQKSEDPLEDKAPGNKADNEHGKNGKGQAPPQRGASLADARADYNMMEQSEPMEEEKEPFVDKEN